MYLASLSSSILVNKYQSGKTSLCQYAFLSLRLLFLVMIVVNLVNLAYAGAVMRQLLIWIPVVLSVELKHEV